MRPLEEIEEDLATAFLWLWNLKDYVKEISESAGNSRRWIEEQVNSDPRVALSADVANLIKHSRVDHLRSTTRPVLGRLKISIPQESIAQITFRADEVEFDTKNLKSSALEWPISDRDGNALADGLELLAHCVQFWEAR